MSHLTPEELARLAAEPASIADSAHVIECSECRKGIADFRGLIRDLGKLPPIRPPLEAWQQIEDQWMRRTTPAPQRPEWPRRALAIAAGLVLFLAGGLVGAVSTRSGLVDRVTTRREAGARDDQRAVVVARLAALENILATAKVAMRSAPADPVLRRVAAAAEADRSAILRRVQVVGDGTWY